MQLSAVVPQQQLVTDFKNSESYDRAGNSFTGELSCPSYPRLIRIAHLSLALGGASAATTRGRQLPQGASAATTKRAGGEAAVRTREQFKRSRQETCLPQLRSCCSVLFELAQF